MIWGQDAKKEDKPKSKDEPKKKDDPKKDALKKDDPKKAAPKAEEKPKPPPPPYPGWELDTLKTPVELKQGTPMSGCWFDPSGKWLFTTGIDSFIYRWELANNKKTELAGHGSWVRSLGFFPAKNLMVSGGYEGRLILWPIDGVQPEPLRQVEAHEGWIRSIAVDAPTGNLVSTGNDGRIALWSLPDLKPIRSWVGHDCHVYQVAFAQGGKEILSADLKGTIKVWESASGQLLREGKPAAALHKYDAGFAADIGGVRHWALSAKGDQLACAGISNVSNAFAGVGNPLIVVTDPATLKSKKLYKPKDAIQGTMWGVAFHPAGFLIGAAGGNGGGLWYWKPEQSDSLRYHKLPDNARGMALSPDGAKLALAFAGGSARVYPLKA
jgi:WD40 repeat protein